MSKKKRRNTKLIAILLACVFLVITLSVALVASLKMDGFQLWPAEEESSFSSEDEMPPEESSASESESEEPVEPPSVSFEIPSEVRAVFLVPGSDFLAGAQDEATVKAEIDKAISDAVAFSANAVVVETTYNDKVIYQTGGDDALEGLDTLGYIAVKAAEKNLLTYATFDVLKAGAQADNTAVDEIAQRTKALVTKYSLAGVYLDNFYLGNEAGGFAAYLKNGSGIGYQNFMSQMANTIFKAASDSIRAAAPQTQVGLFTTAVWANKAANEAGSETNATYQALTDGNADTKAWVEAGLVDFVAVKATGYTSDPALKFKNVVSWWGDLAKANDIKLYPVHSASKVAPGVAGGWDGEELAQQYLEAKEIPAFGGSVYDSLAVLVKNESASTDRLKKAFKNEIDLSYILEKLELTQPTKQNITTTEATYTIMGASDPKYPVLLNGKEIERNASGYINLTVELKEGANTFVFEHKEQKLTYTITRKTEVLKSITPKDATTLEGGMTLTITAMAYPNATVTAKLNGTTINLQKAAEGEEDDQIDKNESYVRFIGTYKTAVVKGNTSIGSVVVTASANGSSNTLQSGTITLTKPVVIGDGQLVEVKVPSAETFPDDTLNDISSSGYYPIGLGAQDYTASNKLEYTDSKGTHYYYLLQSGRRVYADDIRVIQGGDLNGNKVSSASVKSGSGYTYVTFKTTKPVSYIFGHANGKITIDFQYTTSVPKTGSVGKNPMFSSVSGVGSTVTLTLKNPSSFIGFTAAYEGGDLVFKFKNSPGGLSGARIFIDPGHSADSVGASGSYPGEHEYQINRAISEELADILKSNGATVKVLNNRSYVELDDRLQQAKDFNPHVSISVHANSAASSSAAGSEAYYFYGFSSGLASKVSSGMANGLETNNRGAKKGLFYMTRTSEFATTLSETGFLSNFDEYDKMLSSSYQHDVAKGIANGINNYLAAAAGSSGGEVEDGSGEWVNDEEEPDDEEDSGSAVRVKLNTTKLQLMVDESDVLEATVTPSSAEKKGVDWASSNRSVARVDGDGNVIAYGKGTATITATSVKDKTVTAKCTVTVTDDSGGSALTGVKIDDHDSEISVGESCTFTAYPTPDNLSGVTYSWAVSSNSLAEIETLDRLDGEFTAKAVGTVKVTVTAKKGGVTKTASTTIRVVDEPKNGGSSNVTSIDMDIPELELSVGETGIVTVLIEPESASGAKVTWASKNTGVATVKDGNVTAVAKGTTTITATAPNGKSASCKVTVL